jgi:hypothetical protein
MIPWAVCAAAGGVVEDVGGMFLGTCVFVPIVRSMAIFGWGHRARFLFFIRVHCCHSRLLFFFCACTAATLVSLSDGVLRTLSAGSLHSQDVAGMYIWSTFIPITHVRNNVYFICSQNTCTHIQPISLPLSLSMNAD